MTHVFTVTKKAEVEMEIELYAVKDNRGTTVPIDEVCVDYDNDIVVHLEVRMPTAEEHQMLNYLESLDIKTRAHLHQKLGKPPF